MKALAQLFINTMSNSGKSYHYKSSKHDLSFISFENKVYFLLAQDNERCLQGSVKIENEKLSYSLEKSSTWLNCPSSSEEKALELFYDTYNFMSPVSVKFKP